MIKKYKNNKSLQIKNKKKRKTIKQIGGAGKNINSINSIKTIDNLDSKLETLSKKYIVNTEQVSQLNNKIEQEKQKYELLKKYYQDKLNYEIKLFRLYWKSFFNFKNKTLLQFPIIYDNLLNNFTISIKLIGDDNKTILYNLILNIDDIFNYIIFEPKEDYNNMYDTNITIHENYFAIIFSNKPAYNKWRAPKDKLQDKEYIKDLLRFFIFYLYKEKNLFNYDILMFIKMFKTDLNRIIGMFATDKEIESYTIYKKLFNEYIKFIYLYSNLQKKICNNIYSQLLDIKKNTSFTAIQKSDKTQKLITTHKDFLNNLLKILNDKKLYFINFNNNNNTINVSKFNNNKQKLKNKVLQRTSKYLPEKDSDENSISQINNMLAFINSGKNNDSGGKSMKSPQKAVAIAIP